VWETVFDPNFQTSLDPNQAESTIAFTLETKSEITWLYSSIGKATIAITFTAGLAAQATSATLSSAWTGATGLYAVQLSDQETQVMLLTQNSTAVTWSSPLLEAFDATGSLVGNDRYVSYNWEDGTWYYGAWNRSCAKGRAPAMGGYPYGVNAGYLYQHEIGTDGVEPSGTVPISWFMETLDITTGGAKSEYTMGGSDARFTIGGSDSHLRVLSIIPDWQYMTGTMNITLKTKDRPQDPNYVVNGPVPFTSSQDQIDIDAHGSQIVIRFDNATGTNGAAGAGTSFRMGVLQGLAFPYAKR
jgi:hypothetical protein